MLNHLSPAEPAVASRLGAFASLSDEARRALRLAAELPHRVAASRDLVLAGQRTSGALIVLEGWLGRVKLFSDGRRQILSFLVPGDVIQEPRTTHPVAPSTITALCDALLCPAPASGIEDGGLREAYAVSAALDETYLLRQIARLGRMSAYERIHDWLLEMHERLMLARRAGPESFAMPLTQETLADALGLTSVHVNRTLQSMRRDDVLEWRGGVVRLKQRGRSAAAAPQRSRLALPPVREGLANTR